MEIFGMFNLSSSINLFIVTSCFIKTDVEGIEEEQLANLFF